MRLVIAALLLVSVSATAGAGYYSDSGTGWWWYQKEPEKKEEKEKSPKKTKAKRAPALSDYSYDEIWNMHPDDFEKFAESLKRKAVQNPSEENVKDYYEVQEIARKKALAFTNVAQYVWQKYPELTTAKDYPIATPAISAALTRSRRKRTGNSVTTGRSSPSSISTSPIAATASSNSRSSTGSPTPPAGR